MNRTKIYGNASIIISCLNEIKSLSKNKEILNNEFIKIFKTGTGIGIDEHVIDEVIKVNAKIELQNYLIKEAIKELNQEL